jgi:hypothetical protein
MGADDLGSRRPIEVTEASGERVGKASMIVVTKSCQLRAPKASLPSESHIELLTDSSKQSDRHEICAPTLNKADEAAANLGSSTEIGLAPFAAMPQGSNDASEL